MEIDISKVILCDHALKRAKERFNKNTPKEATNYFKGLLPNAKYVGIVEGAEDHKPVHLFAYNKVAIMLSMNLTKIVTVYKADTITYDPLKDKILELHKKRFNRFTIKEKAKQKQLDKLKLEFGVEIAQCKLRMYKTRSSVIKSECECRIKTINQIINSYIKEIEELQSEKRRIARSMISVM